MGEHGWPFDEERLTWGEGWTRTAWRVASWLDTRSTGESRPTESALPFTAVHPIPRERCARGGLHRPLFSPPLSSSMPASIPDREEPTAASSATSSGCGGSVADQEAFEPRVCDEAKRRPVGRAVPSTHPPLFSGVPAGRTSCLSRSSNGQRHRGRGGISQVVSRVCAKRGGIARRQVRHPSPSVPTAKENPGSSREQPKTCECAGRDVSPRHAGHGAGSGRATLPSPFPPDLSASGRPPLASDSLIGARDWQWRDQPASNCHDQNDLVDMNIA